MSIRITVLLFFVLMALGASGQKLHETVDTVKKISEDSFSMVALRTDVQPGLMGDLTNTSLGDDDDGDDDSDGGDGDDDDSDDGDDDDSDDDDGDDDDSDDDDDGDDDDSDDGDDGDDDDSDDSDDDDSDDGDGDDDDSDDSDDDDSDDDDGDDDDDLEVIIHPTLYFVKLDPATPEDSVDALLESMNSEEVWYLEEIGLRLWNVIGFPYTDESGQAITTINEHVSRARKKTRINDSNFNIGYDIKPYTEGLQELCLGFEPMATPTGNNEIVISIFDTGLSDPGIASGEFAFSLEEYSGYDYVNNDDIPEDENGHGTRIAGIIHHIIEVNNITDQVQFDIRKTHDASGQGFLSNLIPAIVDAVNHGSHVLNMSFSYKDFRHDTACNPIGLAIEYARQNDVLVVTSSGNEAQDNDYGETTIFPASSPGNNVLAVTSHNCSNQLSDFGNYGAQSVDIAVIGEYIPGPGPQGGIVFNDGTSYSAAIASAMAAIMGTHLEQFSPERIICGLVNTSSYESSLDGKVVANGFVNFQAAYNSIGENCSESGDLISSISNIYSENTQLEIMPNPVTGNHANFTYHTAESESIFIRIVDQSGRVVSMSPFEALPGENYFKLDISGLQTRGLHILQAISSTSMHSVSFLRH